MNKIFKKVLISLLAFTMIYSQMNLETGKIFAQDNNSVMWEKTDEFQGALKVSVNDSITSKVALKMNGTLLKEIPVEGDGSSTPTFNVGKNGEYTIVTYDSDNKEINETKYTINDFDLFVLKEGENQVIEVLSRIENSETLEITGKKSDTLSFIETIDGYHTTYQALENGNYTFRVLDNNKKELAKKTLEVSSLLSYTNGGSIEVNTADDLLKIKENPNLSFSLMSDIEISNDILSDVDFKGTLEGNGYVIKGIKSSLFNSLDNATIRNVSMQGGTLAKSATNYTIIEGCGFYVNVIDDQRNVALIDKADTLTITNSYVLANIEGKEVAGFVLEGNATINNSYISGYLKGTTVYGFGKDVEVNNSYISASLIGKNRELFTNNEVKDSFYDAQINDLLNEKATAYTTDELTSGLLKLELFEETTGSYPQIKTSTEMKKQAKEMSNQSVIAISNKGNLGAYEGDATLSDQKGIQWDTKNVLMNGNNIQLDDKVGEVAATTEDNETVVNRFALHAVSNTISGPTPGVSTTQATTQISYPTEYGKYYKVMKSSEVAPIKPTDHKNAIDSGWKIVYWTGVDRVTGLDWNTKYKVYTYDGTQVTSSSDIQTNKQKVNGNVKMEGSYEVNKPLTISIDGFPEGVKGTLYIENSTTLDGTWNTIEKIDNFTSGATKEYTPKEALYYDYLQVRFVVDNNLAYSGESVAKTNNVLARELKDGDVIIENKKPTVTDKYSITDKLSASIAIKGKENDVTYEWFYEGDEATVIATGSNYTLRASDIDKKMYVVATAKENSNIIGSVKSDSTPKIEAIKHEKPSKGPVLVGSPYDTMFTIKMETSEGVYQFKITDTSKSETVEYPTLVRGGVESVIMSNDSLKIEANSEYIISVKRIGEYGYTDSEYGDQTLTVTTSEKSVSGDIKIEGKYIFGETLTAVVTSQDKDQTGKIVWYRINNDDKTKTKLNADPLKDSEYTLTKDDVNMYIEASFEGTGKYAGQISTSSDKIAKKSQTAPTENVTVDVATVTDNEVSVTMPSVLDNKIIVGYSKTKDGVPVEYQKDGKPVTFDKGEEVTLSGFQRDSEYYLFVRYADTESELKSQWIEPDKAVNFKTTKTKLSASLDFKYDNGNNPMPGQRIEVSLKNSNSNKGTWVWTRINSDSSEDSMNTFNLSDDKNSTYFIIPSSENEGTKYKVSFKADSGYEGNVETTSKEIVAFELKKYDAPDKSSIVLKTLSDTSLSATMVGVEGQYNFRYKKASEPDTAYNKISNDLYADVEAIIDNLDRNTDYVFQAKRITDSSGKESDWSETTIKQKTDKTTIVGHVTIKGETRNKEKLSAEYQSASYAPEGNDTGGEWSWYRGDTKIADEKTSIYTLSNEDVGKVIKAKYTMPSTSSFEGFVETQTNEIGKSISEIPSVTSITGTKQDAKDSHMIVDVTGINYDSNQDMYYIIQKATDTVPGLEPISNWNKVTSSTIEIHEDRSNKAFVAKETYKIYFVKVATDYILQSEMTTKEVTIGDHTQKGTIAFTGRSHVNKEFTATLKDSNNVDGTWRWYYSDTDYKTSNPTKWTEIKEGFYPKTNAATSTLTVPDVAKGKFLKAEFIADETKGFKGTIISNKSNGSVTKTYTEKLVVKGKPYDGQDITVTLTGSDRSFKDITDIKGVQLDSGDNYLNLENRKSANESEIVITLTGIASKYHSWRIRGYVKVPDRKIYTKEDGADIGYDYLFSDALNDYGYVYGKTINNAAEMKKFIMSEYPYNDRTIPYVITNNINMNDVSGSFAPNDGAGNTPFTGTLDGDYHTIANLKCPLFGYTGKNTSTNKNSVIKNIIILNANIDRREAGGLGPSSSIIGRGVDNVDVSKLMAVNSNIITDQRAGIIAARSNASANISEIFSAGGSVRTTSQGNSGEGLGIGGVAGAVESGGTLSDIGSIGTVVGTTSTSPMDGHLGIGGLVGQVGGSAGISTNAPLTIKNSYTASSFSGYLPSSSRGGVYGCIRSTGSVNTVNAYYDSTLNPYGNYKGTASNTTGLIGESLKSKFGTNKWMYKEGFYPRLTWVEKNALTYSPDAVNIMNTYAATRGAFTSVVDGQTSSANIFNGNINGPIQIPSEFSRSGFEISSSNTNVLKVVNGVITPIKANTNADVIVRYTDSSTKAIIENKYTFKSTVAYKAFENVTANGTANVGGELTATITPTGIESGATYKWYRRSVGSETRELIDGETGRSYSVDLKDAGYQIQVEVSKDTYGTMVSPWSTAVKVTAPTKAPQVNSITDGSATITGQGGFGSGYEYAYADSKDGEKTLLLGTGATINMNGLSRNKEYFVFSRMAAGSGYEASPWGPSATFTTLQSNVEGLIKLESSLNNGTDLKMSIDNTNEQTGTWKIERIDDKGDVIFEIENTVSSYTHTYKLKDADVGNRIRVSFAGNASFMGEKTATTDVIKKAINSAPNAVTEAGKTDHSITVNLPAGTVDIGYRTIDGSSIIEQATDISGDKEYTIPGLARNTSYNIYVRSSANTTNEASPWSVATTITTMKTQVDGDITIQGELKTNGNIAFSVPATNDQVGIWKLEKISGGKTTTTISPSVYEVDTTTRTLSYKIRPIDATGVLKATFTGTKDYEGTKEVESAVVEKAVLSQDNLPEAGDFEVVSTSDKTLNVRTTKGIAQYQFGYAQSGSSVITAFDAIASADKVISINGLNRNTEYDIYIREAAKTGYEASPFKLVKENAKTSKTKINGYVSYGVRDGSGSVVDSPTIGVAKIGFTYDANYTKGSYSSPTGDDSKGTWQWYANGKSIDGATASEYKIPVMYGDVEISVRYIASESSDFNDYQEAKIGTLTKERNTTPGLPKVEALGEDTAIKSKLKITSNDDLTDVYWYVQNAKVASVPDVVTSKDADANVAGENVWFKAQKETAITLIPNNEYIVYAAKLENDTNSASSIVSQRPVTTKKDDLNKIGANVKEADSNVAWKVLQNKELRVDCSNVATNGVWKYYVSSDISATPSETSWKIITSEVQNRLEEGTTDTYAYTNFQVPLKYLGYKLRVVYEGRDEFEGSLTYVSDDALTGTLLTGIATVNAGSDVSVGQPIEVEYKPGTNDEENGYWRWYRETKVDSGIYEKILTDENIPYGVIGLTDTYTPKAADVGYKIYAEYNASDAGAFTGYARSDILDSIKRAGQNKPDAPKVAQVNGTSIQVNLPQNYVTDLATTPDTILGYQEKGSSDEIKWLSANKNDSWIKDNLKANTIYEVYAKFERTSEFKESANSDALEVKTGNESFNSKNLTINTTGPLASEETLTASFIGDGYDQGYFKVLRSDGVEVAPKIDGTIKDKTITMSYVAKSEDIGANLIVQYVAKDKAVTYGGYVEKSIQEVTKPKNPMKPTTPVLTMITYDEEHLEALVDEHYEYALTTTNDPLSELDGQWKKLIDIGSNTYKFEKLNVDTTYYLHSRLAETSEYVRGSEDISAGVNPWKQGSYTITYLGVEGAKNDNLTQYSELTNTFTLKDPSKKGYTFNGWTWNGQTTPEKNVEITQHSSGDKTYTANWTINSYDVTFEKNNTTGVDVMKKKFNEKIDKPVDPKYLGNTFLGWYKDPQCSIEWNFNDDVVQDNMSLYAKWEPSTFSASFDAAGGETPKAIEGKFGSTWGLLPSTQKAGYNFDGWFTEASGGTMITDVTTVPANNVVFYAHWTPISYKIEYSLDGGENVTNKSSYTIEEEFNLIAPTKKGNEFIGWTFDGQNVPLKTVYIPTGTIGDKHFTANWKVVDYTVTYDLDGGINNPKNPSTYRTDDETIKLQIPRKEKNVFIGWTSNTSDTVSMDAEITKGSSENKTFTAHWDIADSVISFDTLGGNDISPIGAKLNSKINEPESPTKVGYTFKGWYTSKDCKDSEKWKFEDSTVNETKMTLYAGWEINKITIHFEDGFSTITDITYNYGSELGSNEAVFTKIGYAFAGWIDADGNKVDSTLKVRQEATYYAKWKVIEYTISYVLNDGENHVDNPVMYTTESSEIALKAPYKTGYVFTGWSDNGKINAGSTGNKTFTANWEKAQYTVTFVSNGGSDVKALGALDNSTITKPEDPVYKGHNFVGWYADAALTKEWNFDSAKVTKDTKLYAKWELAKFKATFMKDDVAEKEIELDYNSKLGTLPTVTKDGYEFMGWYTERNAGEKITSNTTLLENTSYYAQWSPISYIIKYKLDGGTNSIFNPLIYTIESNTIVLKDPVKKGYAFTGWTEGNSINNGSIGDKTFTATWEKSDYIVNFDVKGGNTIDAVNAISGKLIQEPIKPERTGYTFNGWYTQAEYTTLWDFENDVVNSDITLYARWTINTYKAEFVVNNGSVEAEIIKQYNEPLGTLPIVKKAGYDFVGWHTAEGKLISESSKLTDNIVYYAKWNAKEYKISYVLNGGVNNEKNPSKYTIENEAITLIAPSKKNEAFVGWTFEGQSTPTKDVVIEKGSMSDKSYTANWKTADITVDFDSQGGTPVDKYYASVGDKVERPVSPTKTGYLFAGWYKEAECRNTWNFDTEQVSINTTLYAKWIKQKYTISFDTKGGNTINSYSKEYDEKMETLPTPTKSGYTFKGWFDKANEDVQITSETIVKDNMKLYAQWDLKEYKIEYIMDGGINAIDNPDSYTIESNDVVLKAPKKDRYVFKGWSYSGQATPIKDIIISKGSMGDKEYTANWTESKWVITFDSQEGSSVDKFYALDNDKLEKPIDPTREGYTFKGWYKEKACTSIWDFDKDLITDNKTVYANWEANKYTVKFDGNGGSNGSDITKGYESVLGMLPMSNRDGYTFEGWYTSKAGGTKVSDTTTMPLDGTTYYAHWKINAYTVQFDSNGGSNATDITKDYGSALGTLPTSTREGYTFEGWYTSKIGGVKISDTTTMPLDGATYYAHWKLITYKIEYQLNNGINASDNPNMYTIESDTISIKEPTKVGNVFIGWTYDANQVPNKVIKIKKGSINPKTFTAHWQEKEYEVIFDSKGGSDVKKLEGLKWQDNITLPSKPSRDGYIFDGWFSEGKQVSDKTAYATLVKDDQVEKVILQARWVKVEIIPTPDPIKPEIKPDDKPVVKPEDKPVIKSEDQSVVKPADKIVSVPTKEEEIITPANGKRNEEINVVGEVKDGKISIAKNTKVNSGNGKTTIAAGKGNVVVNVSSNVEIKDMEALINATIDDSLMQRIIDGANVEIRVNVKPTEKVKDSDKKAIEKRAKKEEIKIGTFYEVNITVKEDENEWVKVVQLKEGVEIILLVDKKLQDIKADFFGIRCHDGKVEILNDQDNTNKSVTVITDQFSTYAIGYKVKKEKTETDATPWILGCGIMIVGFSVLLAKKKKNK